MALEVAVVGASGKIASQLVQLLIAAGAKVRVIGRTRERLAPLIEKGARPYVGGLTDMGILEQLFKGCSAAYVMLPTDHTSNHLRQWQERIGITVAETLADSRVHHVVNMSSLGVHLATPRGPLAGLKEQEERLNKNAGMNVMHLRPAIFFENLLAEVGNIKKDHQIVGVVDANLSFPQVSARDVAAAACDALLGQNFRGSSVRELLGPREISMTEAAKLLGAACGFPVAYHQITLDDLGNNLESRGVSSDVSRSMQELYTAVNAGELVGANGRNADNTNGTTFEQFASDFAVQYVKPARAA